MSDATATTETANDNGSLSACLDVAEDMAAHFDAEARIAELDRLAALAKTHTLGAKYVSGRDVAETAKLIRRELVAACKAPTGPLSGCVCRVTSRRASMMVAIDVVIVSVPDRGASIVNGRWIEAEDSRARFSGPRPSMRSKRGESIAAAAEAIVDAYNFNKSDSMTDYSHVGFYGGVTFDTDMLEAARAEVRTALALLA